jgi:hypothetical protein
MKYQRFKDVQANVFTVTKLCLTDTGTVYLQSSFAITMKLFNGYRYRQNIGKEFSESESVSVSESKNIFLYPNAKPYRNHSDPQHWIQIFSVVDPDSQGSVTFAGSVTQGFRIRVHIRKWM